MPNIQTSPRAVEITGSAIGNTGETIQFGPYEWLVLERQGSKALLITKNIIERRMYHKKYSSTWDMCGLRKYLNGEFLEKTFNEEERAKIIYVENRNPDNPWYNEATESPYYTSPETQKRLEGCIITSFSGISKGGRRTNDYIFLLSLEEACRYFGDSREKLNTGNYRIEGWEYIPAREGVIAQSQNLDGEGLWWFSDENDKNRTAPELTGGKEWNWWLRSPGMSSDEAASVYIDGSVNVSGGAMSKSWGVRPVLWLNMSSGDPQEETSDETQETSGTVHGTPDPGVPVTASDLIGKWGVGGHVIAEVVSDTSMLVSGAPYTITISGNTICGTGVSGNTFNLGSVKFIMNAEKNALMWSEGTITFQYWSGQTWQKID